MKAVSSEAPRNCEKTMERGQQICFTATKTCWSLVLQQSIGGGSPWRVCTGRRRSPWWCSWSRWSHSVSEGPLVGRIWLQRGAAGRTEEPQLNEEQDSAGGISGAVILVSSLCRAFGRDFLTSMTSVLRMCKVSVPPQYRYCMTSWNTQQGTAHCHFIIFILKTLKSNHRSWHLLKPGGVSVKYKSNCFDLTMIIWTKNQVCLSVSSQNIWLHSTRKKHCGEIQTLFRPFLLH